MFSSPEQRFLIGVMRASRIWRRLADAASGEFGLTEATALPLLYLSRMEKEPSQAELAEAMSIERPSVVWLLDHLSAAGLVERRDDERDRRVRRVRLTSRGRGVTQRIQVVLEEERRKLLAHVSAADLEAGLRVLQAIEVKVE